MAAGAALAAKRGKRPKSSVKGAAKQMEKSMLEKQLQDFAKNKTEEAAEKTPVTYFSISFHFFRNGGPKFSLGLSGEIAMRSGVRLNTGFKSLVPSIMTTRC